jgi:uncharacterized protein (DUF488 family)
VTAVGVGYQGQDVERFVRELASAGVDVVADVRLNPVSRKAGFSRRALSQRLAAAGIAYEHLPALGNPKDDRAGFAGGETELRRARSRYAERLSSPAAREALAHLVALAAAGTVALLCFEADEQRCHRRVILATLDDVASSMSTFQYPENPK